MKEGNPLVCIWCTVFNHEHYVRECLEGFVMQKTDFNFVAVVHDDASTDKSVEIIREFAMKYPDIIKPIYEEENQWSKPGMPLFHILQRTVTEYGSKYVAYCEGDDFWTDPNKLQKQVSYLENHPDFSLCYTSFSVVDKNSNRVSLPAFSNYINESYSGNILPLLFDHNFVMTLSICFWSEVLFTREYENCPSHIDYSLFFAIAFKGKAKFFDKEMCCYRKHPGGLTEFNPGLVSRKLEEAYLYWAKLFFVERPRYLTKLEKIRVTRNIFGHYYNRKLRPEFPFVPTVIFYCYSAYRILHAKFSESSD